LNEIEQREQDLNDREYAFVQQKMNHEEELNRMKEELSMIMEEYRERITRDALLSQQLEQDKKSLDAKELELKELNQVNMEQLELEKIKFKEMLKESFLKLLE
jgi:bisphosphoglycerate-dependent phosphoglycerate mutase